MNEMNETGKFPQTSISTRTRERFGGKTQFHSFRSVQERAARYVATLPAAISGSRGHDALFRVACVLVNGFDMQDAEAWPILLEYNARCLPPWSERELRYKLEQARKAPHQRPAGHLLGTQRKSDPPPPRILGRITLGTVPAVKEEPREARRMCGELKKLHEAGHLSGPDDPDTAMFAWLIHGTGGTVYTEM
jgi:hypothetical protein